MDRAGRPTAYEAALAMTPHALIKISWVIARPTATGHGAGDPSARRDFEDTP